MTEELLLGAGWNSTGWRPIVGTPGSPRAWRVHALGDVEFSDPQPAVNVRTGYWTMWSHEPTVEGWARKHRTLSGREAPLVIGDEPDAFLRAARQMMARSRELYSTTSMDTLAYQQAAMNAALGVYIAPPARARSGEKRK